MVVLLLYLKDAARDKIWLCRLGPQFRASQLGVNFQVNG